MRPIGSATARPEYFDRNPVKKSGGATVAAGSSSRATTTDWSYTVSAGKKAYLEWVYVRAANDSATAINAQAKSYVDFTPSGGSAVVLASKGVAAGAVSIDASESMTGAGLLMPGDMVRGRSNSDNTAAGSSVYLESGFMATEFDF